MDQVHVVRHKVLAEGGSVRRVAREMGISRNTVRRYLDQAEPSYGPREVQSRPVMDRVGPGIEALLAESPRWTGGKQRLTATRLHQMLVAEGFSVGVTLVKEAWRSETAPPRSLRAARVSPGRSGRGGFLRSARGRRGRPADVAVVLTAIPVTSMFRTRPRDLC